MARRKYNNGDGAVMNIAGVRSGKLVAVSISKRVKDKGAYWLCKCDCGRTCTALSSYLKSGARKSCGKCSFGRGRKHGLAHTREYRIWIGIKSRCHKKSDPGYKNYGGRGIKMCERWRLSFTDFLKDVGRNPSLNYSIDRINNDGNYEPGNVRWATKKEQQNNLSRNVILEARGEKRTISMWAVKLGVPAGLLRGRYYKGWNHEAVLFGKEFAK